MNCPQCNNLLPDGAKFCNLCGVPVAIHQPPPPQIPEGFTLDPGSGLHYITLPGINPDTNEYGCWTTWFNAGNGEYRQVFTK